MLGHLRSLMLGRCVAHSGTTFLGRSFARLAAGLTAGYDDRAWIAKLHPNGFVSHLARIRHADLRRGQRVFIGDRARLHGSRSGGAIELEDDVRLYDEVVLQTDMGGAIRIGGGTHVQCRCRIFAIKGSVLIGKRCEIAPACAFFSYDHAFIAGTPIREQGLTTKGDIVIGDDVWLGYGVIVLSGVNIGEGAVVGAGAVVVKNVPSNAIAAGNPARVVGTRDTAAARNHGAARARADGRPARPSPTAAAPVIRAAAPTLRLDHVRERPLGLAEVAHTGEEDHRDDEHGQPDAGPIRLMLASEQAPAETVDDSDHRV